MVQVSNAPEVLLGVHVTTNCCGGGVKIEIGRYLSLHGARVIQ